VALVGYGDDVAQQPQVGSHPVITDTGNAGGYHPCRLALGLDDAVAVCP